MDTGYRTKSILCMPILKEGQVMGVVEMVNKLMVPGGFTSWGSSLIFLSMTTICLFEFFNH
jgi:hypothetical protein